MISNVNGYFPETDINYLMEMGITKKTCTQFLYEHNNNLLFRGHSYTSDGQVWILYDTHNDIHDNFKIGGTDQNGKILRDILKVDIPDMVSYIRNRKIDSILKSH